MITAAPPGTPYHRLARTAAHRWWRPLVGTVEVTVAWALLGLLLLVASLVASFATDLPRDADGIPVLPPLVETAMLLLVIAAVLPVLLHAARWVQRRPAGTVSSVTGRLRWSWLLVCLPVAVVATALALGGAAALLPADEVAVGQAWVGLVPFVVSMAVLLLLVPLQAAAEEFLCRGWLLQAVGSVVRRPWLPIAVQAVVFAALHGWGTGWGFADLLVFGVVTGWLTVRTGGLEAAIALHVAGNLIGFGFAAAFGLLDSDETAADAPWQLFAVDVPVLLAYAAVILWLSRRLGPATLSPSPVEVPPVAVPPVTMLPQAGQPVAPVAGTAEAAAAQQPTFVADERREPDAASLAR